MKNGLGNLVAADVDQLTTIVKNRLKSIQYRPGLIDGFLAQTGLTLQPLIARPPSPPSPGVILGPVDAGALRAGNCGFQGRHRRGVDRGLRGGCRVVPFRP
jgi:hypothetical protein